MKVKLSNVRLSFSKIFEPKPVGENDTLYYSAAFPIEPGSDNDKTLQAAMSTVAKEKWATKGESILKTLRDKGDVAYKLKPLTNAEGDVYAGFEGMYSLNASSNAEKKPVPTLWDNDRQPLNASAVKAAEAKVKEGTLSADKAVLRKGGQARLYDGCYVDVSVDVWPQANGNGKRVNAQLLGIQFRGDGDAFTGGAIASADDFDDLSVTEGDDDLLGV